MALPPDLTLSLPHAFAAGEGRAPSLLEQEVAELFGVLRDPLLRYVLALGMSVPDAEEIVQDVFIALLQHLRQGKPRFNLRGWLFRVAHNQALKLRQKTGRRTLWSVESVAPETATAPDPALNPEQLLASGQRRGRLLAVLRALPERDQSCLFLRAEGLRYREIAEVLGVSAGAICLSLKRSLERLGRADGG
jgi:RNA polymerase sigma-70 factor, ECF subfamily